MAFFMAKNFFFGSLGGDNRLQYFLNINPPFFRNLKHKKMGNKNLSQC
jgi:hypothetical protein